MAKDDPTGGGNSGKTSYEADSGKFFPIRLRKTTLEVFPSATTAPAADLPTIECENYREGGRFLGLRPRYAVYIKPKTYGSGADSITVNKVKKIVICKKADYDSLTSGDKTIDGETWQFSHKVAERLK